jgi:hypothetical protein
MRLWNAERATTGVVTLDFLVLFFAGFFAGALARQRFLYPFFLAGFQIEGVTFYFFNNVLRLHFPLEASQGVFERLAFLQSDFCQRNYTPKLVLLGLDSYCK